MTDFLNLEIGNPTRNVTVVSIDKQTIDMPDGRQSEKIVFTVKDGDKEFTISDRKKIWEKFGILILF